VRRLLDLASGMPSGPVLQPRRENQVVIAQRSGSVCSADAAVT